MIRRNGKAYDNLRNLRIREQAGKTNPQHSYSQAAPACRVPGCDKRTRKNRNGYHSSVCSMHLKRMQRHGSYGVGKELKPRRHAEYFCGYNRHTRPKRVKRPLYGPDNPRSTDYVARLIEWADRQEGKTNDPE